MAYLMVPSDDPHLRRSFMAAMREHEAEDGRADADGLSVRDLSSRSVQSGYARGLRDRIDLRAGTVYWWCEFGDDGPEYVGRVSFTDGRPEYSVRPSRRGEGHVEAMAEAVAPIAARMDANSVSRELSAVMSRLTADR
jgi:hypothetical protein